MRIITIISSCLISLTLLAGPHTLQRGESFGDVARLYGVPLDSLKKSNPDIEEYVGYTIDIPIEDHFVDLGESDLFRRLKRNAGSQKEKGSKKYRSAFEKQTKLYKASPKKREKLQDQIQQEYEEAVECGNVEALYQLGRRYVHGRFYSHDNIPDFKLDINPDIEEFSKGIEYMQIVGLLTGKPSAYIEMAVACGHEDSPIRNPYLCISMLEVYADSKGWPVNELICHMYENGYGINRNLMQAYVYSSDTELTGRYGTTKREKILKEISELPKTKENSFYGNELDTKTMMALGLSYTKDGKITPQGLYWLHKAALQNDADANWTLASILKNGNYEPGSVGGRYGIDQQVMAFVEKASLAGHKEAKEYLTAYREYEAQKAEYERHVAAQKRQEEEAKKARRRQMWANIAGAVIQTAAQTWGQIEYAKQVNHAYNNSKSLSMPSIGSMSDAQWMAKNRLAMDQILQYTVNKTIADWNGTPMMPTDMSAVNLGTDMSPGSPLWSWGMQQQINRMSTQNARMQCETLAFYRRQADMIEQQLRDNTFQPIAGYVNSDGYWISGDMVGNTSFSDNDRAISNGHEAIREKNRSYYQERYGNKDCHICHGTGQCTTCNGSGFMHNPLTSGSSECPNCLLENMHRTGKCRTCQGTGSVYGLKHY